MMDLLGHLEFVKIYLDDIIVHFNSLSSHHGHLHTVFNILRENKAQINFNKSVFCSEEVIYLGHVISKDGISSDIKRVTSFKIPTIKTKRDLQKLLGFLNWFKPFIRDFTNRLNIFYGKLKNTEKFSLADSDTKTMEELVEEIKRETLLNFPTPNMPYELYTEASGHSLGAVLLQNKKLIGLYSCKLKGSDPNYIVVEKETLAILKPLSFFKNIVFNDKITCYTDNKNLLEESEITKRFNRWKLISSEF